MGLCEKKYRILLVSLTDKDRPRYLDALACSRLPTRKPRYTLSFTGEELELLLPEHACLMGFPLEAAASAARVVPFAGIIFLFDAAKDSLEKVQEHLAALIQVEELRGLPLVVMGTSMEDPGGLSEEGLRDRLFAKGALASESLKRALFVVMSSVALQVHLLKPLRIIIAHSE